MAFTLPKNLLIVVWKKLLTCGIEKVGLLCKLSFRLLSHYICIFSLLMNNVSYLSTSILNFSNIISKAGQKCSKGGGGGGEGGGEQFHKQRATIMTISFEGRYSKQEWLSYIYLCNSANIMSGEISTQRS